MTVYLMSHALQKIMTRRRACLPIFFFPKHYSLLSPNFSRKPTLICLYFVSLEFDEHFELSFFLSCNLIWKYYPDFLAFTFSSSGFHHPDINTWQGKSIRKLQSCKILGMTFESWAFKILFSSPLSLTTISKESVADFKVGYLLV